MGVHGRPDVLVRVGSPGWRHACVVAEEWQPDGHERVFLRGVRPWRHGGEAPVFVGGAGYFTLNKGYQTSLARGWFFFAICVRFYVVSLSGFRFAPLFCSVWKACLKGWIFLVLCRRFASLLPLVSEIVSYFCARHVLFWFTRVFAVFLQKS